MKILFTITTGRADYQGVLAMVAENLRFYGHFETNTIGLAVNYDCSFLGLKERDFICDNKNSEFYETIYIGQRDVGGYVDLMSKCSVTDDMAQILSQATGYSNKKNLVYIEAIKRGYDMVLFWDDDEYPLACSLSGDLLYWTKTDVLGAHISAYRDFDGDVAFGCITGYFSPVPLNLDKRLSKSVAGLLGDALSVASDVVNAETFVDTVKVFRGLDASSLKMREIKTVEGGKWISGGNLSVRISAVRRGVVPPFYAPPGTRADDTILSMGLNDARVMQVPAGIFHDAFGEYSCLRTRAYPGRILRNDEVKSEQVKRFCGALKGWLGYAPILLRIRHGENHESYIEDMARRLELLDEGLLRDLPEAELIFGDELSSGILKRYGSSVEADFRILHQCYAAWESVMKSERI